ncbi:hypothetical protein MDA_GLEAN10001450 [Myotis davidii]|uniref:Uncharacterized protein n=1 Tax=Myotis davidii TaxID=225400 RepID=L5M599_MYODS|nr:hypothetical protein MDA_GLEAN10001450 [Myotis davidii]
MSLARGVDPHHPPITNHRISPLTRPEASGRGVGPGSGDPLRRPARAEGTLSCSDPAIVGFAFGPGKGPLALGLPASTLPSSHRWLHPYFLLSLARAEKSEEQQLHKHLALVQAAAATQAACRIQGTAVLREALPHSRSRSSPPQTKEQPQEQTVHVRGEVALRSMHQSEEQSHNSLHLSDEQQPGE